MTLDVVDVVEMNCHSGFHQLHSALSCSRRILPLECDLLARVQGNKVEDALVNLIPGHVTVRSPSAP